jgi:hypothetical protein
MLLIPGIVRSSLNTVYTTSVPINDTIEIVEQMNDKISSTMSSCPVVLFVVCR